VRLEPIAEASILKSPVRENRTPGSVPGRSGNRPSYGYGPSSTEVERRYAQAEIIVVMDKIAFAFLILLLV
jgi:hypothetical protein